VPIKYSNINSGKLTEALIPHEPIHYRILPPNEPHPCDKYGCPREAKYQLGNSYYCDGKAVSHFREIAKTCQEENFELIEDLQQLDIQYSKSGVLRAIFVPCCVWLVGFLFDSNLGKGIQQIRILMSANHRHSAYWLT
jgi:hypothetical protein